MAAPSPGELVPGRGFDPSTWNDATRQAVAAWEAAHPGYKLDGSDTGYHAEAPPTTAPGTGGTGGTGGTQYPNISEMIAQLTGAYQTPTLPTGTSDPLSSAYLTTDTQRFIAALTQASQLAQSNQQNQLRAWELMGANANGEATDAATRWRQELAAQQDVQNATLQQRLLQMYGYDPNSPAGRTLLATTGGQTLEARTADAAQRARMAELLGYDPTTGNKTLGAQQLAQQMQQFLAQQAQQQGQFEATQAQRAGELTGYLNGQATVGMQTLQEQIRAAQAAEAQRRGESLGYIDGQATLGRSTLDEQIRAAQAAEANRLAELTGYTAGGQSTLGQRQLTEQQRQALAQEAARMAELTGYTNTGQSTLGQRQLEQQAQQAELERQLRLQLQSGQLSQQESEFARTYLLQQDANRRAQTQLMGYDESGNLTEQGRAARAGEATQRAQIGAQLLGNPKDVFRAGAYFRALQGADPTGLGLNQGISGFTSPWQRMTGTPQTYTTNELFNAVGDTSGQQQGAVGTAAAPSVGAVAAPDVGGTTTNQATQANQSGGEDEETPGTSPGGPVGMGAGGMLPGRRPPKPASQGRARPQVSPERALAQLIGSRSLGRLPRIPPDTTSEQVRGTAYDPARAQDAIQQLIGAKKAAAVLPGMGPGGPVDAPTWPTGDATGAAMPVLQDASSLGAATQATAASQPTQPTTATSAFNAPMPQVDPSTLAALTGTGGDPTTTLGRAVNDQRLGAFGDYLAAYGVQGLGPQALERQSATQRQLLDAELQAQGLSLDDLLQAYKNTQFANAGDVNAA